MHYQLYIYIYIYTHIYICTCIYINTSHFLTVCPLLYIIEPVFQLALCHCQFDFHRLKVLQLALKSFCGLQWQTITDSTKQEPNVQCTASNTNNILYWTFKKNSTDVITFWYGGSVRWPNCWKLLLIPAHGHESQHVCASCKHRENPVTIAPYLLGNNVTSEVCVHLTCFGHVVLWSLQS